MIYQKYILPLLITLIAFTPLYVEGSTIVVINETFEGLGNTDDNTLTSYDKYPPSSSKLAPSNTGFGSDRAGLNLVGSNNVWSFRYTNTGLTSTSGSIGKLTSGSTYTITFNLSLDDGYKDGLTFGLVTFSGAETTRRNTSGGLGKDTTSILINSGNILAASQTSYTYSYTATGSEVGIGQDVAIRFLGATTSANLDNVSVSVTSIPEPSTFIIGSASSLLLLRRKR